MSDQGRKTYEALIAAAKAHGEGVAPRADTEVIEDLRIALFARIIEWHDAKAWVPTEQHETAPEALVSLRNSIESRWKASLGDLSASEVNWRSDGYPPIGLPKPPPEIWGPEITVDTGGRCPVDGDEEIVAWKPGHENVKVTVPASGVHWGWPVIFRRKLADHPGDSYWHGKMEAIPESGKAGLDVMDKIVNTHFGSLHRAGACSLAIGETFRRWLKGDA